jgi:hypothetical protein
MGCRASDPSLTANAVGSIPAIIAIEVMMIGRVR